MIREQIEDNACRLAKALIQRYGITYEEAMYKLAALRLNLVCDQTIASSDAMQAALVTAINVGKRAFHGGVHVVIPGSIPTRLPWPGQPTLREVCASLGARLGRCDVSDVTQTIFFCLPRKAAVGDLLLLPRAGAAEFLRQLRPSLYQALLILR